VLDINQGLNSWGLQDFEKPCIKACMFTHAGARGYPQGRLPIL